MPWPFAQHRARLQLRAPDYTEERGDLVLLIWGDLPYWTVVDQEFHALLRGCDGQRTAREIVESRPEWRAQQAQILAQLATLRDAGIFSANSSSHRTSGPPLFGTKIENVALNLTRRCNLRCRFCYNLPHLVTSREGELTAGEIAQFLATLRPWLGKRPTLTILGGEPLLEAEKLLAVCADAKRRGFVTLVSTNGTLVNADFAREAARIGLQVQVSLDGHTAALHDAIRGAGSFDKTVAGIRTLVAQGAPTILSLVCHQGNLPHLARYFRLAQSLRVNEARFIPLKRMGGAIDGECVPVPLGELLRHAFTVLQRHPEYQPLLRTDALSIMAGACRYSVRRASCGTGLQTVLLDADGALYPCLNTNAPDFRMANIRDAGFRFQQVWLRSPVLQQVRQHTVLQQQPADEHAGCPVRYWCLGGCRGENFTLCGGLEKRPPHCTELRRGIIEMCWLLAARPDLGAQAGMRC